MAPEDTVAAGRRLDLASLFCLIGRHGPAVLLAAGGIVALLVAVLIYRRLRGRWRGVAVSPGKETREPGCEAEVQPGRPEEELLSGETTDAQSDEVQPEVVDEVVGVESSLKVRRRRRRRQQVDVVPAGKKPPPTHSSPSTPAPVQQLPEVASQDLQEPKEPNNSPQELEKVLAADLQEDVITDKDVAALKVLCPADKRASKKDHVATVEEHLGGPSTELLEGPSERNSEKSLKEPLQKPIEEPSEEHQLIAGPAPAVKPNQTERLDEEGLESVAPQSDIHFSAKETKEEDSQRLQEKQEDEEDKQEKEKEKEEGKEKEKKVQEDLALKESNDENPEDFASQRSQLDLHNQDCHPPFELLGEELLTSFVVVNSDSQNQISGAEEIPDYSPTSDHTNAPCIASPAPFLDECHHFTDLKPETLASCESEDQTSWTTEPPESTPDRLVLVPDIPKISSEAFDLQPAMAGTGGIKEEEQKKEEVKVQAAPAEREPHPEMFLSVQVPEVHGQEKELLPVSTHKEMKLHPDFTQEEKLHPDFTQEEGPHPDSTQEEELHLDLAKEQDLLPNSIEKEELHPDYIQEKELLPGSTLEEELHLDSTQEEELHLNSTLEEEVHPDSTQEEERNPDSIQEELHSDSAEEKMLHPNFANEEDHLPYSIQKEGLPPESAQGEVELILVSAQEKEEQLLVSDPKKEESLRVSAQEKEELLSISTQEDEVPPNFIQKTEELIHDNGKVEEVLPPNSAQEEELPPNFTKKEVKLLSNSTLEEELVSESEQKVQLYFDSTEKEVLLPDSNEVEKLPPNPAQEEEELSHDADQEEQLPLNHHEKDVKMLPTSTQEEKLCSEFEELPPDSDQNVQLHYNLTQKLLPDSTQEEEMSRWFAQEEELPHDLSQKKEPFCKSTQKEEPSPDSTQDDITPPVTTVSWWSSAGRDPAQGDWILIPEFQAATNEDTFGHQVESEYQRMMDQFAAQVEASLKVAVEAIEREGGEEKEMEQRSHGAREEEEEKVEKKGGGEEEQMEKKKAEEQERRRTEISIMEATMDANEWVTDSGQQLLPWLGISTPELAEESSSSCTGGGPAPPVATIPPLMHQTVEVTFRLHYLTWSEQQTLAITGSRPELGAWAAFIPLEREEEGKEEGGDSEGRGLWSGRVRLPAHSQLEWKFVVLDMGRVSRWEECRNRVLDTGDRDQLVHGWWGRE